MKRSLFATLLRALSLLSALSAAVLQLMAVLLFWERGTNYFFPDTTLPLWAFGATLLSILLGILGAILTDPAPLTSRSPFFAKTAYDLPCGLGLFLCGAVLVTSERGRLALVAGLLLLVTAAYICIPKGKKAEQNPLLTRGLAFAAVICCGVLCAYYYFDATMEMNSPIKLTVQVALLSSMLYYTGELRFLLSRLMPRLYLALVSTTAATAALPALSIPVARILGLTDRNDYTAGAVAVLLIAVSAVMRATRLLTAESEPEEPASEPSDPSDITPPDQTDEKGDTPA